MKKLVGCIALWGKIKSVEDHSVKVILEKAEVEATLPCEEVKGVDLKALVGKRTLIVVDLVVTDTGAVWPQVSAVLVGNSPWLTERTIQSELNHEILEEGRERGAGKAGAGSKGRRNDPSGGAGGAANVPRARGSGAASRARAQAGKRQQGRGSAPNDRRGGDSNEGAVPAPDGAIRLKGGGAKTYAARITGLNPKFGFERVFVELRDRKSDSPLLIPTEDGIYEVVDADGRRYLFVKDGRVQCGAKHPEVVKTACEMLEDGATFDDIVEVMCDE